jgi:hypothetical protein
MLSREEEQKILTAFEHNMKSARIVGESVEYPSGGSHIHDDTNPLGIHKHFDSDDTDGAHTHTPQNPGGEHAHGENKGMALIDGPHYHEGFFGDGYHHHEKHEEENSGQIPISKPSQELPKTNPDQPSPE